MVIPPVVNPRCGRVRGTARPAAHIRCRRRRGGGEYALKEEKAVDAVRRTRILRYAHVYSMKTKVTVTIDRDLLPLAKRYARARGVSLSEIIEGSLRRLSAGDETPSFATRWRGQFVPAERVDERFAALAKKYL